MKIIYTIGACLVFCIQQAASAQSATEKVEKRLADLLSPSTNINVGVKAQPIASKASAAVEDITFRANPIAVAGGRSPHPAVKPAKPQAVAEAPPLPFFQDKTPAPGDVKLPTKPLIRLPSVDMHTPLPIPILGQQQKDRASLGD